MFYFSMGRFFSLLSHLSPQISSGLPPYSSLSSLPTNIKWAVTLFIAFIPPHKYQVGWHPHSHPSQQISSGLPPTPCCHRSPQISVVCHFTSCFHPSPQILSGLPPYSWMSSLPTNIKWAATFLTAIPPHKHQVVCHLTPGCQIF